MNSYVVLLITLIGIMSFPASSLATSDEEDVISLIESTIADNLIDGCTPKRKELCSILNEFSNANDPLTMDEGFNTVGRLYSGDASFNQTYFHKYKFGLLFIKLVADKKLAYFGKLISESEADFIETEKFMASISTHKEPQESSLTILLKQYAQTAEYLPCKTLGVSLVCIDRTRPLNFMVIRKKSDYLYVYNVAFVPKFKNSFDKAPGFLLSKLQYNPNKLGSEKVKRQSISDKNK